jgi:transcriptional regulator with XRE-family HTH domain
MPSRNRKRFWAALAECSAAVQEVVVTFLQVVKDRRTTPLDRQRALMTLAQTLLPNPDEEDGDRGQDLVASENNTAAGVPASAQEVEKMSAQEAQFAQCLRALMAAKRISQHELAERVGCSQPAISQMLHRQCRPQKKTILKLAEALHVQPRALWPDIEVAEMLDAVTSFQRDDYVMTCAEARVLADTANRNRPKVRAKSLPTHSQ